MSFSWLFSLAMSTVLCVLLRKSKCLARRDPVLGSFNNNSSLVVVWEIGILLSVHSSLCWLSCCGFIATDWFRCFSCSCSCSCAWLASCCTRRRASSLFRMRKAASVSTWWTRCCVSTWIAASVALTSNLSEHCFSHHDISFVPSRANWSTKARIRSQRWYIVWSE